MAKVTRNIRVNKIPGLPDTTTVSDPETRLFLDRIKQSFSVTASIVEQLQKYLSTDKVASELFANQSFNDMLNKKVDSNIAKSPYVNIKTDPDISRKELQQIFIDPSPMRFNINDPQTQQAEIICLPDGIPDGQKGVVWHTTDTDIATVDATGIVTPVAIGECFLIATSTYRNSITAESRVKVLEGIEITVFADTPWCQGGDALVYTEEEIPSAGDFVWAAQVNSILVMAPEETETEAKQRSSAGVVASVDSREYIVCEDKTYWRNAEADDFSNSWYDDADEMRVYRLGIAGRDFTDVSHLTNTFVEHSFSDGIVHGNTGRIFSKALSAEDRQDGWTNEEKVEYQWANCIADREPIAWEEYTDRANGFLSLKHYQTGSEWNYTEQLPFANYGYMVKTGKSKTLKSGMVSEPFTTTYYELQTFDGAYTCWVAASVWDDWTGDEAGGSTIEPTQSSDGEYYSIKDSESLGVGRVTVANAIRWHSSYGIKDANGIWYTDRIGYHSGYVYNPMIAWTESPCAESPQTVYTYPPEGLTKCSIDNNWSVNAKDVSSSGDGAYSITTEEGNIYYLHTKTDQ